jgi:hypothetical protein
VPSRTHCSESFPLVPWISVAYLVRRAGATALPTYLLPEGVVPLLAAASYPQRQQPALQRWLY